MFSIILDFSEIRTTFNFGMCKELAQLAVIHFLVNNIPHFCHVFLKVVSVFAILVNIYGIMVFIMVNWSGNENIKMTGKTWHEHFEFSKSLKYVRFDESWNWFHYNRDTKTTKNKYLMVGIFFISAGNSVRTIQICSTDASYQMCQNGFNPSNFAAIQ